MKENLDISVAEWIIIKSVLSYNGLVIYKKKWFKYNRNGFSYVWNSNEENK